MNLQVHLYVYSHMQPVSLMTDGLPPKTILLFRCLVIEQPVTVWAVDCTAFDTCISYCMWHIMWNVTLLTRRDDELQVCEVYKLHRETYYMCVDYVDRFLSRTSGIKKSQLQLIGTTALFIAAKMEVRFVKELLRALCLKLLTNLRRNVKN